MYYNRTNLAYEVETGSAEETRHIPSSKKKVRSKPATGILLFICVVYVISSIASLLFKTADVNERKKELNDVKKQYNELVSENKKLEVDINAKIDLRKVETIAIAKLDMNKPKNSQVVYVSAKPQDYGEVITADKKPQKKGWFASIIKTFTGIFAYSN